MKIVFLACCVTVLGGTAMGRTLRGDYIVPTSNPDLVSVSKFPVRLKVREEAYEKFTAIEFPLPQQLTGRAVSIAMKRDPSGQWSGPLLKDGDCRRQGRYLICPLRFQNLQIDPSEVDAHLLTLGLPKEQKDALSQLSQAFSNEPAGILRYRLRGGSSHE